MDDIFVKVALLFIGSLLSVLGVLFVWGFQKLITTLLAHSDELLKMNCRLGNIEKAVVPLEKLEKDMNAFYQRLKTLEANKGELNGK